MFDDSLIRPGCSAAPGSFAALMALYESNFVRLRWLIPDVRHISGSVTSHVPGDCPLNLVVIDRAPYTTTIRLTYFFGDGERRVADPDLTVRVYHDACVAESLDYCRNHRQGALHHFGEFSRSELGQRWARNMMLNKWLEYCSEQGHGFTGARTTKLIKHPDDGRHGETQMPVIGEEADAISVFPHDMLFSG